MLHSYFFYMFTNSNWVFPRFPAIFSYIPQPYHHYHRHCYCHATVHSLRPSVPLPHVISSMSPYVSQFPFNDATSLFGTSPYAMCPVFRLPKGRDTYKTQMGTGAFEVSLDMEMLTSVIVDYPLDNQITARTKSAMNSRYVAMTSDNSIPLT